MSERRDLERVQNELENITDKEDLIDPGVKILPKDPDTGEDITDARRDEMVAKANVLLANNINYL